MLKCLLSKTIWSTKKYCCYRYYCYLFIFIFIYLIIGLTSRAQPTQVTFPPMGTVTTARSTITTCGDWNKQLCNDLRMKKDYDSDTKGRALPVIELLFTKTKVFYGQKHCFKPFLVYLFYYDKMRNG